MTIVKIQNFLNIVRYSTYNMLSVIIYYFVYNFFISQKKSQKNIPWDQRRQKAYLATNQCGKQILAQTDFRSNRLEPLKTEAH